MMFSSEEVVVLFDVFMDCLYGSLFPLFGSIFPLVGYIATADSAHPDPKGLIGLLIASKQIVATNPISLLAKVFPLMSNLLLLQQVSNFITSLDALGKEDTDSDLVFDAIVPCTSTGNDREPHETGLRIFSDHSNDHELDLANQRGSNSSANPNFLNPCRDHCQMGNERKMPVNKFNRARVCRA